jgi:hypothetical protein
MMRTLNFAFVLIAAAVCIVTYRVAEDARVARANLAKTERQIAREHQALVVLGAEWARLTRPQRIQALAERHLILTDAPAIELASFDLLPRRGSAPPMPGGPLRDASIVLPQLLPLPEPEQTPEQLPEQLPDPRREQEPAPYAAAIHVSHRSGA